MKAFLFLFIGQLAITNIGFTQISPDSLIYTRQFTELLKSANLEIRMDSLDHYVLTNKTNPYVKNTDLYLINPKNGNEFIVLVDDNSLFPHLKLSSHVTNLMDNQNDHTVAFYSLDEYFILTELRADWAMDVQFIPKDRDEITGYARSFYDANSSIQITVLLLARVFPLLSTPSELTAIRFIE